MNNNKTPLTGSKKSRINIEISQDHKDFLGLIQHEDAAKNQSEAVGWCIDACQRIEKLYGIDACYVSFHDIRKELPTTGKSYTIKFYDDEEVMNVEATNYHTAAIVGMYNRLLQGKNWGIQYVMNEKGDKVPVDFKD